MTDKDQIVKLCQKLIHAHKVKDADGITSCYSSNALSYRFAPPLASRGADVSEISEWLATLDGPITIKTKDTTAPVAWSAELSCLRGSKPEEKNIEIWFRTTRCSEKFGENWRTSK